MISRSALGAAWGVPKRLTMSDPASGQRGGARAGAGRKRVLTFMQRIELGAYCEDLWTRERRGDLSDRLYRPAPHDEDEAAEGDDGEPILALKLPDKFRKAIKKVPVGLSDDEAQAARDAVPACRHDAVVWIMPRGGPANLATAGFSPVVGQHKIRGAVAGAVSAGAIRPLSGHDAMRENVQVSWTPAGHSGAIDPDGGCLRKLEV